MVFDVFLTSNGISGMGMLWRTCAVLARDFSPFGQRGIVSKRVHPALNTGFVTLSAVPEGVGNLLSDWLACTSLELLSMSSFQTKLCFPPPLHRLGRGGKGSSFPFLGRERPENNRILYCEKNHKNNLDVIVELQFWNNSMPFSVSVSKHPSVKLWRTSGLLSLRRG